MTQTSRLPGHRVWLALLLAGAVLVAACGDSDDDSSSDTTAATGDSEAPADTTEADGGGGEAASGNVFVSGSSTVEPISIRVAELFEEVNPDVTVDVEGPGTGDGFQKFCGGESDISDASRPISDEEIALCEEAGVEYVELKVGIDGIAVLTSPENTLTCLTFADLYALVGPESTGFGNWADAQDLAAELGSTTTFPDASLDITAPGTESGTYDSFIEIALADIAEERGQEETTRPDYTSASDDNVIITNIEGSPSSFGWVGFAYAAEAGDGVKLLEVDGGDGCIAPSAETIASTEYPISRDLFIYVNTAKAAENPGLVEYVDFYVSEGLATAVGEVGYVPLTDDAQAETQAAWEGARPA